MSVRRRAAGAFRRTVASSLAPRSAEAGTGRSGIGPAIWRGKDQRNSLTTPVFGDSSRQVGIVGQILGLPSEAICFGTSLCRICDRPVVIVEGITDFLVGGADLCLLLDRRLLHFPLRLGLGLDRLSCGGALRGLLGGALLRGLLSFGGIFGRRSPGVDPVARVDAVQFGVCHLGPGLLSFRVGESLSAAGLFVRLGLRLLKLPLGGQGIVLEDHAGDFFRLAANGGDEILTGVLCLAVLSHICPLRTTDQNVAALVLGRRTSADSPCVRN